MLHPDSSAAGLTDNMGGYVNSQVTVYQNNGQLKPNAGM